jgi:ethanolamine ammonia-lyase small subunit
MTPDAWNHLRGLTAARIALGRSGGSLPTRGRLDFQLAHARARDAVLAPFDPAAFAESLRPLGREVLVVNSAARDRAEYLRRPDLGRALAPECLETVQQHATAPVDLAITLSDGLSTQAALAQCAPLLGALLPLMRDNGWSLSPIVIARHARVALLDEIGALFNARISLILLGERPGLGSADSLGAYFTHAPFLCRTDADRNCVSNIREGGLAPGEAAHKLHYLLGKSYFLGLSGVRLKDESPALGQNARNLL